MIEINIKTKGFSNSWKVSIKGYQIILNPTLSINHLVFVMLQYKL